MTDIAKEDFHPDTAGRTPNDPHGFATYAASQNKEIPEDPRPLRGPLITGSEAKKVIGAIGAGLAAVAASGILFH